MIFATQNEGGRTTKRAITLTDLSAKAMQNFDAIPRQSVSTPARKQ